MRNLAIFRSNRAMQIGLVAAVALLVRLILLRWRHNIDWDGYFYIWQSQNILKGDFLQPSPEWTPYPLGYPLTIAAVSMVAPSFQGAGIFVSLLAGVLVIVPLFLLADGIGGCGPALLATLLTALNSWLVRYSLSVLTESLFIFLLVLWVWLLVIDFRGERFKGHALTLFAVSACMVFVRPIGLVALAGGILLQAFRLNGRVASTIRLASMGLLITVGYIVYSHAVTRHLEKLTGQPQPSYALQEMSRGLEQHFGNAGNVVLYVPAMPAMTFLRNNGLLIVWRYVYILLSQLSGGVLGDPIDRSLGVFPFYLWPFAAIGSWVCASERWRLAPLIALLPYFLVLPLFKDDCRYYVPLIPFFLLYSAVGVGVLVGRLGRRVRVAAIVGILLVSAMQAYEFNQHEPERIDAREEIGNWLGQHERPDIVFAYDPAPAYYAGAHLKLLPEGEPPTKLLSWKPIQGSQRTYLVAPENQTPPNISLVPIYTSRSAFPTRSVVYRIEF
jgi:hypothetical protein